MSTHKAMSTAVVAAAIVGTGVGTAAPAAAGGVGDFLSPAFGTACANLNNGARATGSTTHTTGTAGGNVAGLPLGSALNRCGGADVPAGVEGSAIDFRQILQDLGISDLQ
ncbi:hypothetical protein [Streptomyces sp. NPDC000229]|uniref:hypothetical protein n=1 Tax=Streptomyces sp. NPDC000229 TaxID=3154247 RepID=UPI003332F078